MSDKGYPLPDVINPSDSICVQLDVPNDIGHITAFMGQIWALTRWYSWARDEDRRGKDVASVWLPIFETLEANFYNDMCNCTEDEKPMALRTNPLDPCEVQYLDENGIWITFFDFGACALFKGNDDTRAILDYIETGNTTNIVNDNTTIYNTAPTTYPPQTDVNALGISDRDKLICYGLRTVLTVTLETIARNKGFAESNTITLSMILGAGVALAVAPLTPIIAGGILLAFGAGWFAGIASIDVSAYRNQLALDAVICHIYDILAGDAMTRASFASALTPNPFDAGTDEYRQAETLAPMMDDVNFYLAFIEIMKNQLPTVDALVNECDLCLDPCGFNYVFVDVDTPPSELVMRQAIPQNTELQSTPIVPNQNQRTSIAPIANQFRDLSIIADIECNRGIQAVWMRGSSNSGWATISTRTGGVWTIRASGTIGVGGVPLIPYTLNWANAEGIEYDAVDVKVTTAQPYINSIRVGV